MEETSGNTSYLVTLDWFINDKPAIDELMHAFDVFEAGKRVAVYSETTISFKAPADYDFNRLVDGIIEQGKKNNKMAVIFVAIKAINGKLPEKDFIRFQSGVQSISDGLKWGVFANMLGQLGYDVETDEHMHVTKVGRFESIRGEVQNG